MTTEEKAKAYDEAIKKLRSLHDDYDTISTLIDIKEELEEIFPELAESEGERIRKELLESFKYQQRESRTDKEWLNGIKLSEVIAWLEKQGGKESDPRYENLKELLAADDIYQMSMNDEMVREAKEKAVNALSGMCIGRLLGLEKQGKQKVSYTTLVETGNGGINALVTKELPINGCDDEQKPADKIEPKFREGDWITDGEAVFHITSYDIDYGYQLETQKGTSFHFSNENVENKYHLWTIEDAKDGDVLAYGDNPNDCHVEVTMIFKSVRNKKSAFTHFHIFDDKFRVNDWCDCGKNAHPATKEQRDLLFQKMKEAGYEWDAELKKVSKITTPADVGFEELGKTWEKEAPEKIYMTPSFGDPDNVLLASFSKSHLDYHRDIEYTRTDAFIDKATSYIQQHWIWNTKMIEDFKSYMKGE